MEAHKETIETFEVEKEEAGIPPEEAPPEVAKPLPPAIARQLIRVGFSALGDLGAAVSGVEDARFNDEELETLADLWQDFVPSLPPIWNAVIGTIIIVGKKATIVAMARKKRAPSVS